MDINTCNSWHTKKEDLLYHTCSNCHRKLKVSQIQFKKINKNLFFDILIFYCRKCDLYFIILKFDDLNSKRGKKYDKKFNYG